jgi:hypothetical protein
MNFTVNVDCTPEEARRFLGLPDMSAVHDIYLDRLKRMVDEGVTPEFIEPMLRAWGPMNDVTITMWRKLFEQVGSFGMSKPGS